MRLRRALPLEALVAALAGSMIGVTFVGAHGDPSLNLHSCHVPNGVIHLVPSPGPDNPNPCKPGEVLDEWSVIGQATNDGPRGARGAIGPVGPQGPAGAAGRDGPAYAFHIVTRSGARSVTARCPAAQPAVGGGWTATGGAAVTASGRTSAGSWTVEAQGGRGARVTTYAVCARAVPR
jgi:hypothetical protein